MSNIASQLEQAYPESNKGAGIGLTPLPEWTVGNIRSTLLVLMGAVGFVHHAPESPLFEKVVEQFLDRDA